MSWKRLFESKPPKNPIRAAKFELVHHSAMAILFIFLTLTLFSVDSNPEAKNAIGIDFYSKMAIIFMAMIAMLRAVDIVGAIEKLYRLKKGEIKP